MITLLYAMEEEVVGVHELLDDVASVPHPWSKVEIGEYLGTKIMLAKCGVGKVFASITAQSLLLEYKPTLLILCGISGGLDQKYKRGDLVFGSEFIQHDMNAEALGFLPGQVPFTDYRVYTSPPALLEKLSSFSLDDAEVYFGRIASGDQFISGEQGVEVRSIFDVDVVDMESAAVAFVCTLNNVPFIVARTISDGANEDAINDFNAFLPRAAKHVTQLVQFICKAGL